MLHQPARCGVDTALEDVVSHRGAHATPMIDWSGAVGELLHGAHRAVQGGPNHDCGVREVFRCAPDLPKAAIWQMPMAQKPRQEVALEGPRVIVAVNTRAPGRK